MPTCTGSHGEEKREGGKERKREGGREREREHQGSLWFSIKHIYFTFIEYTRTESTRIQHGALRWGSVGTREERGVSKKEQDSIAVVW